MAKTSIVFSHHDFNITFNRIDGDSEMEIDISVDNPVDMASVWLDVEQMKEVVRFVSSEIEKIEGQPINHTVISDNE